MPGCSAAGRDPGVSYAVEGSPADVAFGAFTSLGAVFLLFGLTVLLEIQVGLPVSERRSTGVQWSLLLLLLPTPLLMLMLVVLLLLPLLVLPLLVLPLLVLPLLVLPLLLLLMLVVLLLLMPLLPPLLLPLLLLLPPAAADADADAAAAMLPAASLPPADPR